MESLPLFHRITGQPVVVLGSGDAAAAKARLVARAGGVVVADLDAGVAQGARLAFITTEPPEDDAARARAAGLLVNVADRPDHCDFTLPAIVDRAPVLVAIGTGGASAGLAKALRLRLEALFPARLGELARGLCAARGALRAALLDAAARRRALDAALGAGGALDPFNEDAADHLAGWLANPVPGAAPATLEIHPRTPDPDDLTLREARWLGCADVLAFEPSVPPALRARARADAAHVPLATGAAAPKLPGIVVVLRTP